MCDRGLAEDMYEVAQRDDTTINALTILHKNDYDCTRAIQALVKCPISKTIDRKWSDDDQKKFLKGLRQYGKNFFRIRKDLLPHKQTSDLVEYYYLWKKTPQAQSIRPRRRQRPCSASVNLSTTPTPTKQRNNKTNNNNNKDTSEQNSDNDDIDEQYCRHCQIMSKDLQIAGNDSLLLCNACRIYYKKNGQMPVINSETSSPYLFLPLNESTSTSSKRKRTKPSQSPDENNSSSSSSTRSKKRTRNNLEKMSIKQDIDDEDEINIKKEIKLEEQENEKPLLLLSTTNNDLLIDIKTEDLSSTIVTPTPCKQELHSPSTILIDHSKQNNSTNLLLSSPSSAFSRTSKKSLIDGYDSSLKTNQIHPLLLSGDVTSTISSKDNNDLSTDDGNLSDSSSSNNQENNSDEGPAPIACERECYNKSQGIVLLQINDRSISQNSCARTDIILKYGSRSQRKHTEQTQQQQQQQPESANIKQEERSSSKISFSLDKVPPIHTPTGLLPSFTHHDQLLMMNRNNPLFHPLPLHALGAGPKPPVPLSLGFPSPFGPSPHDNPTLRHLDPLSLRLMNSNQLFSNQSPFATSLGRPTAPGLDPATAALLFDPRYRSMIPPFPNSSPSSLIPPPPPPISASSNNSSNSNGTHNHAHIHSHSHTHLHLGNNNESSSPSSNITNGPPLLPPPPLLPFATNPLSGLSHTNPLLHPGGPLTPTNFEALHNLARERELMALMLANNNRFDPMTLALANSFQMPRPDDFSRMNARERSIREHTENEIRRFNLDLERQQQQQLRFPFHHQPDELLRRF